MKLEKLANLIEKNPECEFQIDNDMWTMVDKEGNEIASSDDFEDGNWYSGGNLYGSGIASALVILLNRKGFKISAGPV